MSDESSGKRPKKTGLLAQVTHFPQVRAVAVALWLLGGALLAQIIVGVAIYLMWGMPETIRLTPAGITIVNAIIYTVALGLVVGGMWWLRKWSIRQLGTRLGLQRLPKWKDLGVAILGYVPYIAMSMIIVTIVVLLIPEFNAEQSQNLGFDSLTNNLEFIFAFLGLVIIAPIAEELLFRGYLFGTLRRLMSFIPATIVVSALFGLVHMQWNIALDTFALSVVLCWLREYTGAVWASILLHMLKNGLAFILLFVV